MSHENTIKRAKKVKQLVDDHFEPGRQDRSRIHIYRTVVKKVYPMNEATFWRLMKIAREETD